MNFIYIAQVKCDATVFVNRKPSENYLEVPVSFFRILQPWLYREMWLLWRSKKYSVPVRLSTTTERKVAFAWLLKTARIPPSNSFHVFVSISCTFLLYRPIFLTSTHFKKAVFNFLSFSLIFYKILSAILQLW